MQSGESRWLVVVDARRARLLSLGHTAWGRLRVEERAALEEHWEEREHHRPSMLAAGGRSFAQPPHEREERRRRFGREVAKWIEQQLGQHAIDHAEVLCPTTLLGELRHACSDSLAARIGVRACDVARLTLPQLAAHPAVTAALA